MIKMIFQSYWNNPQIAGQFYSRSVLAGSEDKTTKLRDTNSGQLLLTVQGHTQAVRAVAFSPNGQTFLSAGLDGLITIWDAHTGQLLGQIPKS